MHSRVDYSTEEVHAWDQKGGVQMLILVTRNQSQNLAILFTVVWPLSARCSSCAVHGWQQSASCAHGVAHHPHGKWHGVAQPQTVGRKVPPCCTALVATWLRPSAVDCHDASSWSVKATDLPIGAKGARGMTSSTAAFNYIIALALQFGVLHSCSLWGPPRQMIPLHLGDP